MPFRISSLKNMRVQIIVVMTCLVIYVTVTHILIEKYYFVKGKSNITLNEGVNLEYVVVHLDLKGAPPKLAYLEAILPMLKKYGVNGLLIEYEDMFPYEGILSRLRAANYYKKNELRAYLTAAAKFGFEIIPLIQTFGHLEFVLKHYTFGNLREDHFYADSICPSSPNSKEFIKEMLNQVIRFHDKIAPLNYIHIGYDEVTQVNKCKLCQNRNLTKTELLTGHLRFVTKTVRSLSPSSSILIWDDMFRPVKPIDCAHLFFSDTEVVYWDYTPKDRKDVHINMYKYGRMFDNLWIATAFKGADGPTRILPNLTNRFFNHLHWLNFLHDYTTKMKLYNIKGIILTGWSRYKHGGVLCELFAAAIPSLIMNLILINKYTNNIVVEDLKYLDSYIHRHIRSTLYSSLSCQNNSENILEHFDSKTCKYEESDLQVTLQNLSNATSILKAIMEEYAYKDYYLKNETINNEEIKAEYVYMEEVQNQIEKITKIIPQLLVIENELIGILSEYYDNMVILEYIKFKIRKLAKAVDGLHAMWVHKGLANNTSFHIKNKPPK